MGILRWYAEAFLQQGALQKLHKHGYHSGMHSGYHSLCDQGGGVSEKEAMIGGARHAVP
jgi:hypothetical protein